LENTSNYSIDVVENIAGCVIKDNCQTDTSVVLAHPRLLCEASDAGSAVSSRSLTGGAGNPALKTLSLRETVEESEASDAAEADCVTDAGSAVDTAVGAP
jgi:hypothetical protein